SLNLIHHYFFFIFRPPPTPTLFPYTTLFRSRAIKGPSRRWRPRTHLRNPRRRFATTALRLHRAGLERGRNTAGVGGGCLRTAARSEEHTSELQSRSDLVCRLLLEKKKKI